jgi:hypothetical protein
MPGAGGGPGALGETLVAVIPRSVAEHSEPSPTASVLQAAGFRGDATVFCLNATEQGPIWLLDCA